MYCACVLLQILKWALVASAQETSSLLIEKGKRDASLWIEAMELAPLVQQKQQQQQGIATGQQQQQGGGMAVDIPWSDSRQHAGASAVPAAEADGDAEGAAPTATADDWSDHKTEQQRQEEAQRAHEMTKEAEQAAAADSSSSKQDVEDVAAAAGVDDKTAKHAADMASIAEQPKKKQRVGEAAATASAAVHEVGKVAKSVLGGRDKTDQ